MTLTRSDEVDLLTALHDGVLEQPRWKTFLARMQRRTRADHVSLIIGHGDVPVNRAAIWFAGQDVRAQAAPLDELAVLDPVPYHRLRPGRVYAAMEMIDPADAGHSRFRRDYLERIGVRFGRFMRVTEPGGRSAWLSVMRAADEFSAADGALLSSLAPHLSIALRLFGELDAAHRRAAVSSDALDRAGIGWTAFNADGRAVDAGGAAPSCADHARGDTLAATPPPGDFTAAPPIATVVLTRRAVILGAPAAAALARLFALSAPEARLAVSLASGASLAEAAIALGLTIETARTYSKRLFVKTGTRGQPDLVRLVLGSIAMLASPWCGSTAAAAASDR